VFSIARALVPLAALLAWAACMHAAVAAPAPGDGESVGERIFQRGVLGSGKELEAVNDAGLTLRGQRAACANCHRRSGLGSREGRSLIPPITASYLFRPLAGSSADRDLHFVEGVRDKRAPYTEESLARVIRTGIDSEGRQLKVLMPHFSLGDADMKALIAYLRAIDVKRTPGVTDEVMHFATIITPDADPVKRKAMLDVLENFFTERNRRQMAPTPHLRSDRVIQFMVHRQWRLHVWQLNGPELSWGEQLDRFMQREPVFAVLSGLAGRAWAPVHRFCERARVPCLFPNVEVPLVREGDFYSVYFNRGVLLEADLIASRLLASNGGAGARSVGQVYRAGDSGADGAAALAAILRARGITVHELSVPAFASAESLASVLRDAEGSDALVVWLRQPDLASLDAPAAPTVKVFISGLLGGLEHAPVPTVWRGRTQIAYPVDLPERRVVRTDFAYGWFRIRHIPVVAEQVQVDTLLACGLVSETLTHLSDTFVRDYLIERIEDMVEHRVITGFYPRLTLGSGQRFASKGGYLVRWGSERGTAVVAETPWLVP
jgi:cytochrome c553